jgi:riboflavin kinase/FMN adenylyltransferase
MTHIFNLSNVNLMRPSVVTIGIFDSVHRGHQHLIRRLVTTAHASSRFAVVLTFFPHPDVYFRRYEGRYYLTTPDQRAQYLLELGVDYVITHPFNDETRQIRASDFVDRLLHYLKMDELWVGEDFAMGYKREGNVDFLNVQAQEKNFSLQVIDMLQTEDETERISSTLIREALAEANVEQVRLWQGRSFAVSGEVVHGMKRGRMLGFPTANIDVWNQQVLPANGVYTGWAYLSDERFMAMTNVGIVPMFNNKEITVEAHLLDFDRDIYGENLTITFEKFLRPEMKFESLDGLIEQIHKDCIEGREFLLQLEAP